jgi:steroid 5-alpha reductase family enzyme
MVSGVDPLPLVLIVATVACAGCWIASVLTSDTSWVDRVWSIVPVIYVWIFAGAALTAGADAGRLVLMAILATAWGARLTFNFARKGGYAGMEDYRWAVVRGRMNRWQFQLFNIVFIVFYQNVLLILITLPALVAWQNPAPPGVGDLVLAVVFAGFLAGETLADQQQWNFHSAKKRAGGTLDPGFVTTGLWRFSRHPNFFFEQAQWWTFYAMGSAAAVASGLGVWGGALNWTIAGPALLTLLFLGSTALTEWITSSKYPDYALYQRSTSKWVPLPPRRAPRPRTA